MPQQTGSVDGDPGPEAADAAPRITAHETRPDRAVFTETGNTDGWIATDVTVDVTE